MDTDKKNQFVQAYVEALRQRDLEAIRGFYDEQSVCEDPYGAPAKRGVDDICAFYEQSLAEGISVELTGTTHCCGDAVAVPYVVRVGSMEIDVIAVFNFADDGKVRNMRAYWGPENTSKV